MLSFECIKNEKSVYFLLTSAHFAVFAAQYFTQLATRGLDFGQPLSLRRVCCPTLHLVFSIDYSFVVSALALHCKEFTKFYNWNIQRILQRLKIKWIVAFDGLNIWI